MSLRDEYRAKFGPEEGDRLHDEVQAKIDDGLDEAASVDWWMMVRRQRAAGEQQVAELLDDLCRRITFHGVPLDPRVVWRGPRQTEIDDEQRELEWALRAYARMSMLVTPALDRVRLVSDV